MLKAKYPSIRPSLLLDFANTQVLDPRINFTRASTGTYMNAEGVLATAGVNAPRFDFSPDTEECLGLLLEESRTNLMLYSESFENWLPVRSTISTNTTIAPDSLATADSITGDGTGFSYVYRSVSLTQGTAYSCSCYFKAGSLSNSVSIKDYTELGEVSINLTTLAASSTGIASNPKVEAIGNGWYRLSATFTPTIATGNHNIAVGNFFAIGNIYIWGMQIEAGTFATSYIPTTSAQITRASDYAYVDMSSLGGGTNIGSVYIDVDQNELSAVGSDYCILFSSSSTTYANWFGLRRTTTGVYVNGVNGSASSNYIMNSGNNSYNKFAFSFNANSWNYSVNGNSISTLTPITPIGSIYMKIGALQTTTYGRIAVRKVAFYPTALPIDQLQALTT